MALLLRARCTRLVDWLKNQLPRNVAENSEIGSWIAMPIIFGIYGFDFSTACTVSGVDLIPFFDAHEAALRAGNVDQFLLTGYGRLPDDAEHTAGGLSHWGYIARLIMDGMTFCQQQAVVVTKFISMSVEDAQAGLRERFGSDTLPLVYPRSAGMGLVEDEGRSPGGRAKLLNLFVEGIRKEPDGPLAKAIYRQIEIARLSTPYWELELFLAFSGLEILARNSDPRFKDNGNAGVPISHFLQSHGFDVSQTLAEDWAAARNAAFHRGEDISVARGSGRTVNAIDNLYHLRTLLGDACLKLLGFDDGHVNWPRWVDRDAFI